MRLVGSMAGLMVRAGLCALPSAAALAGWEQSPQIASLSTSWCDPDGLFARFGVAP